MKLNLRTLLIIVICISTISIAYINIIVQLLMVILSLILFFVIHPSKKKTNRMLHRLKNVLYLILVIMLFQILFRRGGEEYFRWLFIAVTSEGLTFGISIALRFLLIIIIAGLLFEIPFYDYLLAFRAWKFPYELTFIIASVIHFIPIFGNQFKKSKETLIVRGIYLNSLPIKQKLKALQILLFPVLAKAISEVKYRSISLELKAFRLYATRTYLYEKKLRWFDYIIQGISLVVIVLFLIFLT